MGAVSLPVLLMLILREMFGCSASDLLAGGFAVSFLVLATLVTLLLLAALKWRETRGDKVVLVVVLGDVGRSPRMQYHCLSLVQHNYTVELVGYGGQP